MERLNLCWCTSTGSKSDCEKVIPQRYGTYLYVALHFVFYLLYTGGIFHWPSGWA
jgi:hypothetical protein